MVMLERELQDVAGEESATPEGRFSVHLHLTGSVSVELFRLL